MSRVIRFLGPRLPWPELLISLILLLLPGLFFWRLLTPYTPDRMRIAAGDFTEQYFPLRAFTAQQWVRGELPLWNPYLFGGQPALADIQSGAFYPLHGAQAVLWGWFGPGGFPVQALEWQVVFHFALAALGSYGFARRVARDHGEPRRRARLAGVVTALVFTYSGYLTGFPVQQLTILAVSCWLPWLLWAVHGTVAGWWAGPLMGALAMALALLAGHPQTALYLLYMAGAYALFRVWQTGGPWRRSLSRVALSLGLGGLLAAAQLLPTLAFIQRSLRADLSYEAVSQGLPLIELVAMLYPGYLGGSPQYIGWAALLLMALAWWQARPRAAVLFWGGVSLLSLLLAFGGNTFLYPLLYLLAPGFEMVRQQERALLLYSFGAAMLSGFGALTLIKPLSRLERRRYQQFEEALSRLTLIAMGALLLLIYGATHATARGDEVNLFAGVLRHHLLGLLILGMAVLLLRLRQRRWLRRGWGMALLATWVGFNLFTVNWQFNLQPPAQVTAFQPDEVVQFLQQHTTTERIVSGGLLPGGHSAASVYGLRDLTGNTPLQVAAVAQFMAEMPAWRLWQLLAVRYVVDERELNDPGLPLRFAAGGRYVYEMSDPFPRAWWVSQTEVQPTLTETINRLREEAFDLRAMAIVAQPLSQAVAPAETAHAELVAARPTQLVFDVASDSQQLLVISHMFDAGWQATLSGGGADAPLAVERVNGVLLGVVVPSGQHTLTLVYQPLSFWWGRLLSVGAGLVLLGWGAWQMKYLFFG